MKASKIVLILFLFLPIKIFAQSDEAFFTEFSEGWKLGDSKKIARLLDDKIDISTNGKAKSFSRHEATEELLRLFGTDQPVKFSLKHKGASADGQVYIIGRLDTREGKNYKIVCRARSLQAGYRIFKLDVEGESLP